MKIFKLTKCYSSFNINFKSILHKPPVIVSVTGSSGNVGYPMVFRIASGEMLGSDQPIILNLVHRPENESKVLGIKMELEDCAFPLLQKINTSSNMNIGFKDADYALLVGSIPISKGLKRSDLFKNNCKLFVEVGKALNDNAKITCKVLVVANPCNTNCLITMKNAKNIPSENFHALSRLDHNRALNQLALQTNCKLNDIERLVIWGNHSSTMYPDIHYSTIKGKNALNIVGQEWYENNFISKIAKRWAEVYKVRGSSSAASAANAAIDHMKNWVLGSSSWVSMSLLSKGEYGVPKDIVYSFPCTVENCKVSVVQGLEMNEFSKRMMKISSDELLLEKQEVKTFL